MNLRKQLRVELREHEQLEKEKRKEEEKKLIRSPEDWNIIEKYISNLLIELSSSKPYTKIGFRRRKFISIDLGSPCMLCPTDNANKNIILKNGSELHITHKDMQRFCKQHKLKLKYFLDKEHDFAFSNRYIEGQISTYLIGV